MEFLKFILLIFLSAPCFAGEWVQKHVNFQILPLMGYAAADIRIGNITIGGFSGTIGLSTLNYGLGPAESVSFSANGGLISYWPGGALKTGSAYYIHAGSNNSSRTLCSGVCSASTSQGQYGAILWQYYWIWRPGINLSVGLGAQYMGVTSTTGTNPIYPRSQTYLALPVGIGWAF